MLQNELKISLMWNCCNITTTMVVNGFFSSQNISDF